MIDSILIVLSLNRSIVGDVKQMAEDWWDNLGVRWEWVIPELILIPHLITATFRVVVINLLDKEGQPLYYIELKSCKSSVDLCYWPKNVIEVSHLFKKCFRTKHILLIFGMHVDIYFFIVAQRPMAFEKLWEGCKLNLIFIVSPWFITIL